MQQRIDWVTFTAVLVALAGMTLPIFLYPDESGQIIIGLGDYVTKTYGIFYLWTGLGAFIFVLWAAFSKFGEIKLGAPGEKPAFSTFSWAAMLFCSGIGSGVMYWGTIEWAYYLTTPPFNMLPGTSDSIEWAAAYGLFHWGPTAWAIYCLPALPIAYIYHVRNKPILKISEACRPVIGRRADGWLGKMIDLLFIFGLLGASGTTLGLSIPMIARGVTAVTGIEQSYWMNIVVLLLCTALFSASVYSGLEKGIKKLSDLNLLLGALLLVFVGLTGPTLFLFKVSTNSAGLIFDHFLRLSTWVDPIIESGFPESWTMFYWAWWIVYSPFVGLFIAKISRGRTIKQMVIGTITWGSIGCALFFMILGNYALYLELNNLLPVVEILNQEGAPSAIISVIGTVPFGEVAILLFAVLALIFLATTFDSTSYMLASVTQRHVHDDPARWNRLFWAFALAIVPTSLMFIGGLKTLQTAAILGGLPIIFVLILLGFAFVRLVNEDDIRGGE